LARRLLIFFLFLTSINFSLYCQQNKIPTVPGYSILKVPLNHEITYTYYKSEEISYNLESMDGEQMYVIGFSKDGKVALIDNASVLIPKKTIRYNYKDVSFYVYDLENNKIIHSINNDLMSLLLENNILPLPPTNQIVQGKVPFELNGDAYSISISTRPNPESDVWWGKYTDNYLISKNKGKKVISSLNEYGVAFLGGNRTWPFYFVKSPYDNKILLVEALLRRDPADLPNRLELGVVGVDLQNGFKKD